ncbi:MAG: hypothetical protein IPP49_07810 [Saprospiraceae bacterium]|nr:hypothetical protein [Saprospiraceae bacterium]
MYIQKDVADSIKLVCIYQVTFIQQDDISKAICLCASSADGDFVIYSAHQLSKWCAFTSYVFP